MASLYIYQLKKEIFDQLDVIKNSLIVEADRDEPDQQKIQDLHRQAYDLTAQLDNFDKSNRVKKKSSIEWKVDDTGSVQKQQKKRKVISNWDALREVQSERSSSRPRAKWLQEGILVVHRKSQMPIIALLGAARKEGNWDKNIIYQNLICVLIDLIGHSQMQVMNLSQPNISSNHMSMYLN